jgi:hypothetical protein
VDHSPPPASVGEEEGGQQISSEKDRVTQPRVHVHRRGGVRGGAGREAGLARGRAGRRLVERGQVAVAGPPWDGDAGGDGRHEPVPRNAAARTRRCP